MPYSGLLFRRVVAAAKLRALPTVKARRAAVDLISWNPGARAARTIGEQYS
jgi:hypothetical protein